MSGRKFITRIHDYNNVHSTISFSVNDISCPENIYLGLVPFSESGISKYSSLKKDNRTHKKIDINHIINLRNFECKSEHCLINSNNFVEIWGDSLETCQEQVTFNPKINDTFGENVFDRFYFMLIMNMSTFFMRKSSVIS